MSVLAISHHDVALNLLVSLAIFSAAWSQNTCPGLRAIQSSQKSFANVTAQLKGIVASYDKQQSSESLISLMQLLLARQLMAELDHKNQLLEVVLARMLLTTNVIAMRF